MSPGGVIPPILRVFVVLLLLWTALFVPAASPVAAQGVGSSELTYQIDETGRFVQVEEVLWPDQVGARLAVRLPPSATDIELDGGEIVEQTSGRSVQFLDLALVGESARLRYRVPDDSDQRDGQGTRVGASRVAFTVWPNMQVSSLRIVLPEGFASNPGGAFQEQEIGDLRYQYVLDSARFDDLWGLRFVASLADGVSRQTVVIREDSTVDVIGLVEDPTWVEYAVSFVETGVPRLEEMIGQPWPATELELLESELPEQLGYGGWFDIRAAQIEISDDRDPALLLHELSHAWFNDSLFEERWMIEGFAEAYSVHAARDLGTSVDGIITRPDGGTSYGGLTTWRRRFFWEDNWASEIYGYQASGWVITRLFDEIGPDRMQATLDGMFARQHAFWVEGDTRASGVNDWRRLLDMLEIRGESDEAEDLFRRYVVTNPQQEVLDRRSELHDLYFAFEERTAGGDRARVPEGIRYAMSDWDFDAASRGIERAEAALIRMDELAGRAEALNLDLPLFLDDVYAASDTGFNRLADALDDTEAALVNFERAEEITEEERRNFVAGRLDQLNLLAPTAPVELNQDRETEPFYVRFWYLGAALVLLVLLGVVAAIAARLPQPVASEFTRPALPDRNKAEIPIYRPSTARTNSRPAVAPSAASNTASARSAASARSRPSVDRSMPATTPAASLPDDDMLGVSDSVEFDPPPVRRPRMRPSTLAESVGANISHPKPGEDPGDDVDDKGSKWGTVVLGGLPGDDDGAD